MAPGDQREQTVAQVPPDAEAHEDQRAIVEKRVPTVDLGDLEGMGVEESMASLDHRAVWVHRDLQDLKAPQGIPVGQEEGVCVVRTARMENLEKRVLVDFLVKSDYQDHRAYQVLMANME